MNCENIHKKHNGSHLSNFSKQESWSGIRFKIVTGWSNVLLKSFNQNEQRFLKDFLKHLNFLPRIVCFDVASHCSPVRASFTSTHHPSQSTIIIKWLDFWVTMLSPDSALTIEIQHLLICVQWRSASLLHLHWFTSLANRCVTKQIKVHLNKVTKNCNACSYCPFNQWNEKLYNIIQF